MSTDDLAEPRTAFSLLGHDIRLEMLLALLDHWRAAKTEPQRYSELMRAIGMEDSGKFNYHLEKLRGVYLEQADDGYVPTASATALYRAVLAHRPTESTARFERHVTHECPDCDEQLHVTYDRSFLTLQCTACDSSRCTFTYPFPENGLADRTDEQLIAAVSDRARSEIGLARTGQCPDCAGRTTVSIAHGEFEGTEGAPVAISCDTCTWTVNTGYLLPLLSDARVTGALTQLDVPIATSDPWALPVPESSVVSTDPLELELTIQTDAGSATICVDESLSVRSVCSDDSTATE